jgi:hypothetical protein
MLPFAHAAVGYACYVAYSLARTRRIPGATVAAAAVAGSQVPDLIDKPLAFLGVLSSGRSLGHSLAFAAVLVAAGWAVARATRRDRLVGAVLVGHLSHLPADGYRAVLAGDQSGVGYLFWPVVPARRYRLDAVAPWERLADAAPTPGVLFQAALAAGAVALWYGLRGRTARRARG